MNITLLFSFNFIGMLIAWSMVAWIFVLPKLKTLDRNTAIMVCLSPQMFRVMVLGILHPVLTPSLSMEFALPTVIVDLIVAESAVLALFLLKTRNPHAEKVAWFSIILGLLHILVSGYFAPEYNFPEHLAAHWYIPVIMGPIMIVSIFMTISVLRSPAANFPK